MQNEPTQLTASEPTVNTPTPNEAAQPSNWQADLSNLLKRAAAVCVDHNVELDDFMRGAWQAYVAGRPGYREHLEDMQLREQLDELRKAGKLEMA